ncbi:uncharacterized protein [Hemitrygon akajei]|uniref:uncharacterized protein n=1 Tax=Hemitrygon akajei TaxID=2704970 RepID=UPI003BF97AD9
MERLKASQGRDRAANPNEGFKIGQEIQLVPPFEEMDVDKFFLHFEKVAVNQNWPKGKWAVLLQSVLRGKAQQAYSALSMDESKDYEEVKRAVLRSYELVPEAYQQKFQNLRKPWNHTYLEFAREMQMNCERWCASKGVVGDYDKLLQLILMEQFKVCIPESLKTYLDEKETVTLSATAKLADEYALTHKTKFSPNKSYQKGSRDGRESPLAKAENKPGASGKGKEEEKQAGRKVPNFTCYNCGKAGHIASKCFAPKKETGKGKTAVPTGCIESVNRSTGKAKLDRAQEGREKFISEGTVSVKEGETPVPVRTWRDTGDVYSAAKLTSKPVNAEDPPIESKIYPACAITRSMSRKAAEKGDSLNESRVDLAETFLPTLYERGLPEEKEKNSGAKESKGDEADLVSSRNEILKLAHKIPLGGHLGVRKEVMEAQSKDEKQMRQLEGPGLDMDDLSGLTELFSVGEVKCVPEDMRAVLDEKDAATLAESAGLADEVVLTRKVEFTPEGSCPESNWEDQGNLEFEKGTGIESLGEADVPLACVQDVESQDTEPCVEAQEKSEVSDLVEKECNPFGSDRLGSVKKGLTVAPGESENSQSLVLKVSNEMKAGDVNIFEGKGKSIVPKLLNKINLKSGLILEALTMLKEQWLVNKVLANQ